MSGKSKWIANPDAFKDAELDPAKMYWVGFLLADGNIPQSIRQVNLGLAERDVRHVEAFRAFVGSNAPIRVDLHNGFPQARFSACNAELAQSLTRYGIVPAKTLVAKANPLVLASPYVGDFWRGVVDGDGWVCFHKNGRPILGLCGTLTLVKQFWDFANGICPGMRSAIRLNSSLVNYRTSFCGRRAIAVLRAMGYDRDVIMLRRKQEDALKAIAWGSSRQVVSLSLSHETLIRLAEFIDEKAYMSIRPPTSRPSFLAVMTVTSTSDDLPRFQALTGLGKIYLRPSATPGQKQIRIWHFNPNDIRALLPLLLPHLQQKKERAELLVELLDLHDKTAFRNPDAMKVSVARQQAIWAEMA